WRPATALCRPDGAPTDGIWTGPPGVDPQGDPQGLTPLAILCRPYGAKDGGLVRVSSRGAPHDTDFTTASLCSSRHDRSSPVRSRRERSDPAAHQPDRRRLRLDGRRVRAFDPDRLRLPLAPLVRDGQGVRTVRPENAPRRLARARRGELRPREKGHDGDLLW